jgi:hypothetical protein
MKAFCLRVCASYIGAFSRFSRCRFLGAPVTCPFMPYGANFPEEHGHCVYPESLPRGLSVISSARLTVPVSVPATPRRLR